MFVLREHQGRALGNWLVEVVLTHPELQGLRRWMLATADAHALYQGYRFRVDGQVPAFRAMLDQWEYGLPDGLREAYDLVSPDGPEHFPMVMEKMMALRG